MEITYKNKLYDLIIQSIRYVYTSPINLVFQLLPLIFILKVSIKNINHGYLVIVISTLIVSLMYFVAMFSINIFILTVFSIYRFNGKGKEGITGVQKLKITAECLIEETPLNKSEFKWAGIYKVSEDRFYLRIWVEKMRLIIIPKRELKNQANGKEFIALLYERIKNV